MKNFKLFFFSVLVVSGLGLSACSTNPATGKQQFTALMSPQQEIQVGASEHQSVAQQFGFVENAGLNAYVNEVGHRVTSDTERSDVQYKFYVLDSPIVNAFALPGGYIYVSRGLLALANSEAELASVLGHEAGHITGRHSAERYSRGVVTSLGAGILSAAIGSSGASQALGLGANLYMSSYSRSQESEADTLGLRYMAHSGYDPQAVPSFLYSLNRESSLEAQLAGRSGTGASYFSTHPPTSERVNKTRGEAAQYPQKGTDNVMRHLKAIDGMVYGDSESQGFVRGQSFYHPKLDFTFSAPEGFRLQNSPTQVVASASNGAVLLFDMAKNPGGMSAAQYIANVWLKDSGVQQVEPVNVNGQAGATAAFAGSVNGRPVTIRVVAIARGDTFARFQIAIPQGASAALVQALRDSAYSFRSMSASEKNSVRPYHLRLYTAKAGDSVASLARRQPFTQLQEERFRILNGLDANEGLVSGRVYKIITEN